ncbi:hypothetical protein F4805DRAFT_474391 [Annulohypoxylon moriforme]|nr:hypothetical protein F4805DRAFT_474391 [Annulohypoxylon moriforme]
MEDSKGLGVPLADPKDAIVDIVFVHGLNGGRTSTWTSESDNDNPNQVFWPRDLLPSKCPNARILSFGYNASALHFYPIFGPKHSPPAMTISNHSSALLDNLASLRSQTNSTDRPLIFIAHSLGGLVCADAVSKQLGADTAKKNLVTKVCGMIFLGTPFAGSKQARWVEIGTKLISRVSTANEDLIETLQERSKKLIEINNNFTQLIKARDRSLPPRWIEIACYFEGIDTYVAKKNIGSIVDSTSATLPGITPISINDKDHTSMSKFNDVSNPGFVDISGMLFRWIQDIDRITVGEHMTGSINFGSTSYSAPISNNEGVIATAIVSTQKYGLRVTGTQKIFYNREPKKGDIGDED